MSSRCSDSMNWSRPRNGPRAESTAATAVALVGKGTNDTLGAPKGCGKEMAFRIQANLIGACLNCALNPTCKAELLNHGAMGRVVEVLGQEGDHEVRAREGDVARRVEVAGADDHVEEAALLGAELVDLRHDRLPLRHAERADALAVVGAAEGRRSAHRKHVVRRRQVGEAFLGRERVCEGLEKAVRRVAASCAELRRRRRAPACRR